MSKHKKTTQEVPTKQIFRPIILFVITCAITTAAIIMLKNKSALLSLHIFQPTSRQALPRSDLQYADPYITIRGLIGGNKEKVLLIDMRNGHDYNARHFKNTVNVYFPYENDREGERSFVKDVEKKASEFKKIILLPYSSASTTGEDAAHLLIEAGIDNVWVMKIGWNELYSLPGIWIPEDKANTFTLSTILEN